jgi:hypothetical protein
MGIVPLVDGQPPRRQMERGVYYDQGRTLICDRGQNLFFRKKVSCLRTKPAQETEARGPLRRAGQVKADDDEGFATHDCPRKENS